MTRAQSQDLKMKNSVQIELKINGDPSFLNYAHNHSFPFSQILNWQIKKYISLFVFFFSWRINILFHEKNNTTSLQCIAWLSQEIICIFPHFFESQNMPDYSLRHPGNTSNFISFNFF